MVDRRLIQITKWRIDNLVLTMPSLCRHQFQCDPLGQRTTYVLDNISDNPLDAGARIPLRDYGNINDETPLREAMTPASGWANSPAANPPPTKRNETSRTENLNAVRHLRCPLAVKHCMNHA